MEADVGTRKDRQGRQRETWYEGYDLTAGMDARRLCAQTAGEDKKVGDQILQYGTRSTEDRRARAWTPEGEGRVGREDMTLYDLALLFLPGAAQQDRDLFTAAWRLTLGEIRPPGMAERNAARNS